MAQVRREKAISRDDALDFVFDMLDQLADMARSSGETELADAIRDVAVRHAKLIPSAPSGENNAQRV